MNAKYHRLNEFMMQARQVYPHHEFARKSNVCTLRVRLVSALCYLEERAGSRQTAKIARLADAYGMGAARFAAVLAEQKYATEALCRLANGEPINAVLNNTVVPAADILKPPQEFVGSGQYDPEFWGMSHCGQDAKEEGK